MDIRHINRRKDRRAWLEAPVSIRRLDTGLTVPSVAKNVSLAGVYFETEPTEAYAVNEPVVTSVMIGATQQQAFPFTCLAGRGRVVRLDPLAPDASGRQRLGVAVAFEGDLTALSSP